MMDEPKKQSRRARDFQEQIIFHGGDGRPLNLATIEEKSAACERGQCLRCGGHWHALHTHIWKHYEKELRAEGIEKTQLMAEGIRRFREEFQLPGDVHFVTQEGRESQRRAKLNQMSGPGGQLVKDKIAETLSRPHPERRSFKSWSMVKLISKGIIADKVAKKLGLKGEHRASTVNKRAESLGLREFGTECVFDCGKPFTNGRLLDLRRIAGFNTSDEFDECAGLPRGRSDGSRRPDTMANPEHALLAMEWRDGVLAELIEAANSGERVLQVGRKYFPQDQILKTFLPELGELNNALNGTMDRIRREAREYSEWTVDDLCEKICTFAEIEESTENADTRWRMTLRFLWQAEEWIKENMERLRATEVQNDSPLVREMIGFPYGASHWTVQNALKPSTERIEASNIQGLILRFAPKFARPKPKVGRRRGQHPDTKERIRRAAGLEMARPRWTQERMAPFVFWDTPDSCQDNIRPFLSSYRNEIDAKKQGLTRTDVQEIVRQATAFDRRS